MVDMIKTVGADPCVRPLDEKEIQILSLSQGQTAYSKGRTHGSAPTVLVMWFNGLKR